MSIAASLCLLLVASPALASSNTSRKVPQIGFYDPAANGGSFLDQAAPGLGEPLNAIISGNSDADILVDAEVGGGLRNYFLSLGFSSECLGQTDPGQQAANLGDGHGYVNQTAVIRWNFGDPSLGTCRETIEGGNHFRYWVQNGPLGNSGAVFMAVSYEYPLTLGHNIIPDGYNLGRDWLVGNITHSTVPITSLTNTSTFSGSNTANAYTYNTSVQYLSGYLQNSSIGVNHNDTVPANGRNAADGLVALLTVKITSRPPGTTSNAPPSTLSTIQLTSLLLATFLSLLLLAL